MGKGIGYLLVLSCLIQLKKKEGAPRSPFIKRLNNGEITIIFNYVEINLGEISVEELLAKGLPGLLPLLPLTEGGNQHETIDIMIERLVKAGQTDLLGVGYMLASKVFSNEKDLQWLKGRFAIMNDFLADSPIYQEIIGEAEAKGIETGKMQALTQTRQETGQVLLYLVDKRFPALRKLARLCVNEAGDYKTLLHLLVKGGMAQTEQEARAGLQAFLDV